MDSGNYFLRFFTFFAVSRIQAFFFKSRFCAAKNIRFLGCYFCGILMSRSVNTFFAFFAGFFTRFFRDEKGDAYVRNF